MKVDTVSGMENHGRRKKGVMGQGLMVKDEEFRVKGARHDGSRVRDSRLRVSNGSEEKGERCHRLGESGTGL